MTFKSSPVSRLKQLSDREIIATLKRHNTVTQAADKLGVGRGILRDRCLEFSLSPGLAGAYANLRERGIAYRAKARAGKVPHVQKQNGKPIEVEAEESSPKEQTPKASIKNVKVTRIKSKEDEFVSNLITIIEKVELSDKARVKLAKALMA